MLGRGRGLASWRMQAEFDVIIIGGGVVGLALAAKLSATGSVLLLEQHSEFGTQTSSRNSEVIHAGLYYQPNSLKERLCIAGRHLLYDYAHKKNIVYQKTGKLIVSQKDQCSKLDALESKAKQLDIPITRLTQQALKQLEPHLSADSGLLSTQTGIIDSHTLMQSLAYDSEQAGGLLVKRSRFEQALQTDSGFNVRIDTDNGAFNSSCETLINVGGLHATQVAQKIACSYSSRYIADTFFCRGSYFSYQGRSPFKHLVYPLPDENLAGLGIHATLDLAGQTRFGPDAHYIDVGFPCPQDYQVDKGNKQAFFDAIKAYFPTIQMDKLQPDYAGIRPKLVRENEPAKDFEINVYSGKQDRLVELFGIESPGLTASLALADYVFNRMN